MTANRDFKRKVRDRQARTGESYMTALRHVLAQRTGGLPSAIPTVEFVEVSAAAATAGLKCRLTMSPALVHEIDVAATVRRFRDLLLGAPRDRSIDILRGMALMGKHPEVHRIHVVERVDNGFQENRFRGEIVAVAAVHRAATGTTGPAGPADPADPDERVVVFSPWPVPVLSGTTRPPLIIVSPLEDMFPDPDGLLRMEVLERSRIERDGR